MAGPPPVRATEQELSHCSSWKLGPRTQGGSFPFSQARFRLGVRGRPLLVEFSHTVAGEPLVPGSEACGWFDVSAGSVGGLAAHSLRPPVHSHSHLPARPPIPVCLPFSWENLIWRLGGRSRRCGQPSGCLAGRLPGAQGRALLVSR